MLTDHLFEEYFNACIMIYRNELRLNINNWILEAGYATNNTRLLAKREDWMV